MISYLSRCLSRLVHVPIVPRQVCRAPAANGYRERYLHGVVFNYLSVNNAVGGVIMEERERRFIRAAG